MNKTTMTCNQEEEVSSIVLIPSSGTLIFNVTTTTTLEDGDELSPSSVTLSTDAPAKLLAELLRLMPTEAPVPM